MNNRTKKQHFIPRFYLRQFTNNNGELWTYDCQRDALRQTTPENTAYETNIYTPEDEEGKRIDLLEDLLSKVEDRAASILPDLLEMKPLDDNDKAAFSEFLATMYARSPAQLRQVANHYGEMASWVGDHVVEQMIEEKKADNTLTDFDLKMRDLYSDKSKLKMDVDRRMGLNAFNMVEPFSELLQKMCWTFEISENQQLITSDNPFFWVTVDKMPSTNPYGFGLAHPNAVIPFPLTPNLILRLDWQKVSGWSKHLLVKERARLANKYQARYKNKFLYFRDRDEGFRRLGIKYKGPVQNLETSFNAHEISVVRKLK